MESSRIFRFNNCDKDLKLKIRNLLSLDYKIITLKIWDLKIYNPDLDNIIQISKGWLYEIND